MYSYTELIEEGPKESADVWTNDRHPEPVVIGAVTTSNLIKALMVASYHLWILWANLVSTFQYVTSLLCCFLNNQRQWRNYHGSRYSNAAGTGRVWGPGPTNNKNDCRPKM